MQMYVSEFNVIYGVCKIVPASSDLLWELVLFVIDTVSVVVVCMVEQIQVGPA